MSFSADGMLGINCNGNFFGIISSDLLLINAFKND